MFAVGLIASCLAALGLGEIQDSAAIVTVSGQPGIVVSPNKPPIKPIHRVISVFFADSGVN